MRYALIDNDGELHVKDGGWLDIRAEVGPEGPVSVRIAPILTPAMFRGWVNDVGLFFPDRYPRNIVGSLVLMMLGAAEQPYAGPVVITGWDPPPGAEMVDLTDDQVQGIRGVHQDVRAALAGDTEETFDAIREVADWVRTTPAPTLTISTLPLGGDHHDPR